MFALCRYALKTWRCCSIKKRGSEEENKIDSDMAQNRMRWFRKKINSNVSVYNHFRLRRSGRICYFGHQPKAGAPRTVEDNPIDLCDEENY